MTKQKPKLYYDIFFDKHFRLNFLRNTLLLYVLFNRNSVKLRYVVDVSMYKIFFKPTFSVNCICLYSAYMCLCLIILLVHYLEALYNMYSCLMHMW